MSGSWDPWRTAKEWTLLEAAYICCGERPVTDDERRLKKTAHPAHIHAMARRLTAEVPSRVLRDGLGRVRERIFQAAAVWDFAKQSGFRLPWEASAESPPSSAISTETLLRQVAVLAYALAEKSGTRYRRGEKPNALQIAEAVQKILAELPDAIKRGLSRSSIRESISAGWSLLESDDEKTGKSPVR